MAKFYFRTDIGVTDKEECIHIESLDDIEKYFSKDNWIHKCYMGNLYVKVLDIDCEFKYEVYADIFEKKMLNHFIGYSDSMLEYKK